MAKKDSTSGRPKRPAPPKRAAAAADAPAPPKARQPGAAGKETEAPAIKAPRPRRQVIEKTGAVSPAARSIDSPAPMARRGSPRMHDADAAPNTSPDSSPRSDVTASPRAPESSTEPRRNRRRPQAQALTFEDAPVTRRSSPLPPSAGGPDIYIPPLPAVTIEPARPHLESPRVVPGYDLDNETVADVAPVGPTEARAAEAGPESERISTGRAPPRAASVPELEQQIRELEARLDQMMHGGRGRAPADAGSNRRETREDDAPTPRDARSDGDDDGAVEPTRELFSTDYYLRQWGRAGFRQRTEEVDEFGLDPAYEARFRPLLDFLYTRYFRVDTEGTYRIPETGPCLIVSNHSGGPLPYDGVMLRTAVRREHPKQRELRWLAEDFIYYLPFVGAAMNRLGAVRACQENAERLLTGGRAVAVFPEGAKGIGKLYKDRYRLQRFGRGGFIRLCLRTRTPIVPCAVLGAEESNPMLYRLEYMAKTLGIPYVPVTPTFPALGPLGLLPAPTKWKIRFGEPLNFEGYGPEAADDEILVGRLSDRVRTTIQGMLDRALAERRSVWFG